jgi:hypothetical protein
MSELPSLMDCQTVEEINRFEELWLKRANGMSFPKDACANDMLVIVRWQNRSLAVPLSHIDTDAGEATQAINEGHYWLGRGYSS